MEVSVWLSGKENPALEIIAPTVDVAQLLANAHGFMELDVEPMGPGRARLRCRHPKGASITLTGNSVSDVCRRLIDLIAGECR